MQSKEFIQFSVPLDKEMHQNFKMLSLKKSKNMRDLFYEMLNEFFEREENQKILINIR